MTAPPDSTPTAGERWPSMLTRLLISSVGLPVIWLLSGRSIGVPGQWTWEVRDRELTLAPVAVVVLIGVAIMGAVVLGMRGIRRRQRSDALVVAGLVVLVFALQWAVVGLADEGTFKLIASTASPVSTEYFTVAWELTDPWEFCRGYADVLADNRYHHVATHPPGAVLFYWLCIGICPDRFFEDIATVAVGVHPDLIASLASEIRGVSMVTEQVGPALFSCAVLGLCAALVLVPLHALARSLAGRRVALLACGLYALAPAPILFFQGLDALIALLALTAIALAHSALDRGCWGRGAAAGIVLALACFISFGAVAAVGVTAVYAALYTLRAGPAARRTLLWVGVAGAVGFIVTMGIEHFICGGRLPAIFTQAMASHREFTWVEHSRTYLTWLGMNPLEFAWFMGLPVCVIIGYAIRRLLAEGGTRGSTLGLAALAVLALLVVSGSVRGEVGRVWLLLMPPLIIWAACWLSADAPRKRSLACILGCLMLVQLLVMGATLTPVVMPY